MREQLGHEIFNEIKKDTIKKAVQRKWLKKECRQIFRMKGHVKQIIVKIQKKRLKGIF